MPEYKKIARFAGAVLLSAAGWWFGTGLHPLWPLVWLAPVPVLFLSTSVSPLSALVAVALARALGALNEWTYLSDYLRLPLVMRLGAVVLPALVTGLFALIWRRFAVSGKPLFAALSLSTGLTAVEYVYTTQSPNGTFDSQAYTQLDFLPVVQLAALTGIWGINFLIWFFPGLLSAALVRGQSGRTRATAFAVLVVVTLSCIAYGFVRLGPTAKASGNVRATALASDARIFPTDAAESLHWLERYADESRRAAMNGSSIIVLPEKIAVVTEPDTPAVRRVYTEAARKSGTGIVVGISRLENGQRANEALLFTADGQIISYDKHRMIPGIELGYQPGNAFVTVPQASGVFGLLVCKDMDFPAQTRIYGARHTALMLVPAWDFNVDAWVHSRMAILRCVESGFAMVRSAKKGLLTIADDRGRILSESHSSKDGFSAVSAVIPLRADKTLYNRWGDWFAWVTIAAFAGLFIYLLWRRQM
jgi:apolipoprotein N-acyltransferase